MPSPRAIYIPKSKRSISSNGKSQKLKFIQSFKPSKLPLFPSKILPKQENKAVNNFKMLNFCTLWSSRNVGFKSHSNSIIKKNKRILDVVEGRSYLKEVFTRKRAKNYYWGSVIQSKDAEKSRISSKRICR